MVSTASSGSIFFYKRTENVLRGAHLVIPVRRGFLVSGYHLPSALSSGIPLLVSSSTDA
jgi:hypothetical protein